MKRYTIDDLREGKCILKNNGTAKELEKILKLAFPNDECGNYSEYWQFLYFGKALQSSDRWEYSDRYEYWELPTQYLIDFLIEEKLEVTQPVNYPIIPDRSIDEIIKELKTNCNKLGMDVEIKFKPKH